MDQQAMGITPELYSRLRQILMRCGPFASDRALAAVFVDARIHPWAGRVPAGGSKSERVDALIALLMDQHDDAGQHALVLLVQVLRDRTDRRTACYHELAALAEVLAPTLASGSDPYGGTPGMGVGRAAAAPTATQGSIAAGRDVIIAGAGAQVTTGGIRADRIEAQNVVDGVQMQGGTASDAAALVKLARAIKRGGITAAEIKADNVVSGLQFVAGRPPATVAELRAEVTALRQAVAQAVADGEIARAGDAEDVEDALAKAARELAQPQPDGRRVVRKLADAADILTAAAEVAAAANKVGLALIELAPLAAALWQLAQAIF